VNPPRFSWPFDEPAGGDSAGMARARQPVPIETRVARMLVGGRWISVVSRKWLYGDTPRCRLCDHCTAVGSECLLLISERVEDRDAPLYSTRGSVPRADPP
jgi:hypothetical protein